MLRLRTQIFLVAFALGTLPLLALVAINLSGHIRRHEEVNREQIHATLELQAANLQVEIDHYRDTLSQLARLPQVRALGQSTSPVSSSELQALISGWLDPKHEILAVTFAGSDQGHSIQFSRQDTSLVPGSVTAGATITGRQPLTLSLDSPPLTITFHFNSDLLLARYDESFRINSDGFYLQLPANLPPGLVPETNAFEDFPNLAEILADGRPAIQESSAYTLTWMPLVLDGPAPSLWLGTPIDRSAAVAWKNSLIRNIITIILAVSALVLIIASLIARKVDHIKEQILTGLNRVMNHSEEFRFAWTGPREITTMAEELSQLARQYVTSARARREAEAALRENQENFRNLANSAQDAIVLMNHQGNISYWNQTAEEMFGYSSEEALGQPLHNLIAPKLPPEESRRGHFHNRPGAYGPIRETIELLARRKNQTELPVELSLSEARIKERWHSIWIIRDISERKWAEEKERLHQHQLIQADKMASLGLLVSGVAHEINNPNSIALLNTPMLAKAWASVQPILEEHFREHGDFPVAGLDYSEMREQIPRLFQELEESSKRIRTIVKDLKDYARKDSAANLEPLDLNQVCRTAVRLTANLLKRHTDRFREVYHSPLPKILGHSQRLEQVVINLLQNSCEALADRSGAIALVTGITGDGGSVWLEVRDQGGGIPPEALKQLTDPFFTTKRNSGGTGLGLSVSAGIVKEHGGSMNFTSSETGTTVTVTFPVWKEIAKSGQAQGE
jgi:PAS domain S-box-containing protein